MLVLVLFLVDLTLTQDYCSFTPQHTLCSIDQSPGSHCNGDHLDRGVTTQEIQEILEVHNRYRSQVALGLETRGKPGPQAEAANMRELTWDAELAKVAQAHADQCRFAHDCTNCRKVERFDVGQNLYIYKQSRSLSRNDWDSAITSWYDEVALFNRKHVEPFQFSSPTGHYTAVAWANTDKVGCGATSYKDGQWFATLYTCDYGPSGNFIRGQMYLAGPACSSCPQGTSCSSSYPGLCSSLTSNTTSTFNSKPVPSIENSIQQTPSKTTAKPKKPITVKTTRKPTRRTTVRTTTIKTTTIKAPTTVVTPPAFKPITDPNSAVSPADAVGSLLFRCNFAVGDPQCKTKNSGSVWSKRERQGHLYIHTHLRPGDSTEFFFQQLVEPPTTGIACLDFRYKKLSSGDSEIPLTVLAWPRTGRPGRVSVVQDSPDEDTWVRAQVTYRKVDTQFVVMFRARNTGAGGSLVLAVSDVRVIQGACPGKQ